MYSTTDNSINSYSNSRISDKNANSNIDKSGHALDEKKTILIVDDVSINIDILAYCLGDGYKISASQDSSIALKSIALEKPSMIILDLFMPEIDGFEFCRIIKSEGNFCDIPIVFITSASDAATLSKAFAIGAVDYITKPISSQEVRARIKTHLRLKAAEDALREQNHLLEIKVAERTRKIQEKQNEINEVQHEAILRLCLAAELRDKVTGMHIRRIQEYSALLGRKCGLPADHVELLYLASAMHDLGKIGIPDSILLKPGKLDADEWVIMKSHTVIGAQSLANSRFKLIQLAQTIARSHHERWDGKGYPDRLKGLEIPMEARIVSIVDSFDAMLAQRPYKMPMPLEKVLEIIRSERGQAFDPAIVDIFLANITEFQNVATAFSD
ncbi:HD domain-containing phosphohydrolase [Desulfomicrobium salsuginis]